MEEKRIIKIERKNWRYRNEKKIEMKTILKIVMLVVLGIFVAIALTSSIQAADPNDWTIGGNTVGFGGSIGTMDNYDVYIITNNVQRINVMANGDVGIGVASPTSKVAINDADTTPGRKALEVLHNTAITGTGYGLHVQKTGASTTNVAGYFSATQATNNYGLIVENGYVGIGTTSPSVELDVNGNIYSKDTSGKVRVGWNSGAGIHSIGIIRFYADSDNTGDDSYIWYDNA